MRQIDQNLSLNKSRADEGSAMGMKNVYSFKSLSDAEKLCFAYFIIADPVQPICSHILIILPHSKYFTTLFYIKNISPYVLLLS